MAKRLTEWTVDHYRAWGAMGGKQRAKNLSPKERRKIASKAAKARERYRRERKAKS